MLAGPSIAMAMFAQVAGEVPASPAPTATQPKTADGSAVATQPKAAERCPVLANAQPGEIIVCGQKPQGYRIDPDVLEASRKKHGGGRPKRPERMADTSCSVVGPMGCIGANPGINLIGAALTAAEMASRLSKGQEIGSMFITDPQPTEYQLYVEAKRRREAEEAEAALAAKVKAKAVAAAAAAAAAADAAKPESGE
jgi:uncharacterized protein (DUF4415 family)